MLFRIQKKYLGIKYSIDICKYENSIFVIKGWMFSERNKIDNIQILINADVKGYLVDISKDFGVSPNSVRAWMSLAAKYLREDTELNQLLA